jgi:hypothetical protein
MLVRRMAGKNPERSVEVHESTDFDGEPLVEFQAFVIHSGQRHRQADVTLRTGEAAQAWLNEGIATLSDGGRNEAARPS